MRTEHILIMRFSAMGDVAMTVPVVYSLARNIIAPSALRPDMPAMPAARQQKY